MEFDKTGIVKDSVYEDTNFRYVALMRARQQMVQKITEEINANPALNGDKRNVERIESIVNYMFMPLVSYFADKPMKPNERNRRRTLSDEKSVLMLYETFFNPNELNKSVASGNFERDSVEYNLKYALYRNAILSKRVLDYGDRQTIIGIATISEDAEDKHFQTILSKYCAEIEDDIVKVAEIATDGRHDNELFLNNFWRNSNNKKPLFL